MSWMIFRKRRIRALESAMRSGKVDKHIAGLLDGISKNEKLATLSSCAGRIFLAKWKIGKVSPDGYYRIWHKADREEIELALSGYALKQLLWFVMEPFSLSVAAKDTESAFSFIKKMEKRGVGCSVLRKQGRIDIEAKGPFGMNFPVNPIDGQWNEIVDIANNVMGANLTLLKKLEKVKW